MPVITGQSTLRGWSVDGHHSGDGVGCLPVGVECVAAKVLLRNTKALCLCGGVPDFHNLILHTGSCITCPEPVQVTTIQASIGVNAWDSS